MGITRKETIITVNNTSSGTEAETNIFMRGITKEKVSLTVRKTLMVSSITTSIFTEMTNLKELLIIIAFAEMKLLSLRILINIYNLNLLIKEQDSIFTEILFTVLPFKLNFLIQITITNNKLANISHLLLTTTVHNRSTIPIFQVMNMTVTPIIHKVWILPNMRKNNHIHQMAHQKIIIIKELTANNQWIPGNRVLILRKCLTIIVHKETMSILNNKWP